MTSRIYSGKLEHVRLSPVHHSFSMGLGFMALDLEDLEPLSRKIKGFGYNRAAPVSLKSENYLTPGTGSFIEKLQPWIEKLNLKAPPFRITLVTSPRWWGYIFNPVSFYLLRDASNQLCGLIAEVNNTFGDRHIYAVPLSLEAGIRQAGHAKEFHVSPFNDMQGTYQFSVREHGDELYIGVDLYKNGEPFLRAWMEGNGDPLTPRSLWKHYLRHPLRPWLTMPRIIWQALCLKYRHKLSVFKRPEPSSSHTILSRNSPRMPPYSQPE